MSPADTDRGNAMTDGIRIDDNPGSLSEREWSHTWNMDGSEARRGVSVCQDWGDLVHYFSKGEQGEPRGGRSAPSALKGSYVVIVRGEDSPDKDHDERGRPHDPYLLVDVEVVESRRLTIEDVADLTWRYEGGKNYATDVLAMARDLKGAYEVDEVEGLIGGHAPCSICGEPNAEWQQWDRCEDCV